MHNINLFFALLCIALCASCQHQVVKSAHHANELSECLSHEDVIVLNTLINHFEQHLSSHYDQNLNQAYKQYLYELSTMSFSQDFFKYPTFENDMAMLRGSSFYKNNWILIAALNPDEEKIEIPSVNGVEQAEEDDYELYIVKPDGPYINCLVQQNKNTTIKNYLNVVIARSEINITLVAELLHNQLTKEALNDQLIRLIIAINLHYQVGLLLTEKNK